MTLSHSRRGQDGLGWQLVKNKPGMFWFELHWDRLLLGLKFHLPGWHWTQLSDPGPQSPSLYPQGHPTRRDH